MGEQMGQSEGILPDAAARCHDSLDKLNIAPLRFPAEPHGGCSIRITLYWKVPITTLVPS